MTESVDCLLIGAGPTGLGAAWRLSTAGHEDWCLCEAEATAGGLAGSVTDEHGFVWDLGGHVQFSHYDYFDDLMDDLLGRDGWLHHQRESWVWMRERFIPYPFQLNLHRLPLPELWECVQGLLRVSRAHVKVAPKHYGEWVNATFGEGLAKVFLRPYNFKVWACPLEEMSWDWIGDRVATVDLERVLKNILHQEDDVSWGPNNRFRFPKHGGTGRIWTTLADRLDSRHPGKLRMKHRLVRLDAANRLAEFSNGASVQYRRLLSTIPLDALIRQSDLKEALAPALADLRHSCTHVIGVAMEGRPPEALATKCWMYFPEDNCPFYRVTVFSNYSPNNVPNPANQWSLMAEVSESPAKPVNRERVVEDTIQGMRNTRLIAESAPVHHTWYRRLPHGYPTPSLHRDRALRALLPELAQRGVYSRGRFGAWKYEVSNQDHSFAQGVECVDHWLTGSLEETLAHPELVNARRPKPRS